MNQGADTAVPHPTSTAGVGTEVGIRMRNGSPIRSCRSATRAPARSRTTKAAAMARSRRCASTPTSNRGEELGTRALDGVQMVVLAPPPACARVSSRRHRPRGA
jgi:hypothetical protein